MSGLKARVAKLENIVGGKSGLHYVQVIGFKDESRQESIDRVLQKRGITMEEVGYISYFGSDGCREIDLHNYRSREDLIGYWEAQKVWKRAMANIPPSRGLPNEQLNMKSESEHRSQNIET